MWRHSTCTWLSINTQFIFIKELTVGYDWCSWKVPQVRTVCLVWREICRIVRHRIIKSYAELHTSLSERRPSLLDINSEAHDNVRSLWFLNPRTDCLPTAFSKQKFFTFRPWTSPLAHILLSHCCLTLFSSSCQMILTRKELPFNPGWKDE